MNTESSFKTIRATQEITKDITHASGKVHLYENNKIAYMLDSEEQWRKADILRTAREATRNNRNLYYK